MKNNIEQNNKMQEMFVEKDNMIKKKDEELTRIHNKCSILAKQNEDQTNQIEQLKGGFVFLQQFTEDDYDKLKYLSKKVHQNDRIYNIEVEKIGKIVKDLQIKNSDYNKQEGRMLTQFQQNDEVIKKLQKKKKDVISKQEKDRDRWTDRVREMNSKLKNIDIE